MARTGVDGGSVWFSGNGHRTASGEVHAVETAMPATEHRVIPPLGKLTLEARQATRISDLDVMLTREGHAYRN